MKPTEQEIELAKSLGWECLNEYGDNYFFAKGNRRVWEGFSANEVAWVAADTVYGHLTNHAVFHELEKALQSPPKTPREYNPATDYPVLLEAAAEEHSLACAAKHLRTADIAWPADFNDNRSEAVEALDRDICKSWGR